ncbi:hypothetical protein GQ53DRAFT_655086 [Thozetella sp. PMI_491]|nr:hypothetical protein GQ53DRAFT_655086 [Thozetella sp. PMI_491]
MARSWSLARIGAAALLFHSASATLGGAEEYSCQCAPENTVVRYIVVEMPLPNATNPEPIQAANAEDSAPAPSPLTNTTATYGPISAPDIDLDDITNVIPKTNVSLYYGQAPVPNATEVQGAGSINMTLAMGKGTVALEYISAIRNVSCSDDSVIVSFNDKTAFQSALDSWSAEESLVLVTNHLGNCDAELGRGFFKVDSVASNYTNTIVCSASPHEIQDIAEGCELTFSSLPASKITRRLTLDPSLSLSFDKSIPETVIFSQPPYVNVTAKEASFTSSVTFSGYLKYNFWGFKLEQLYFDLDASFGADVGLSAEVAAAYQHDFTYAPDEFTYSLVSVPGLIDIGPGVAFSIGLNLSTDAAVGIDTEFGIQLPDGNVHIDVLDGSKTSATGWEPTHSSVINITEKATIEADVGAGVTVELVIKALGGLIDLSSGLTATPQIHNKFTLSGLEEINGTVVSLPEDGDAKTCDQGVYIVSDFLFSLKGFATKWISGELYSVEVPIADQCYHFN